MNHPTRENVFLLRDDDGVPTGIIMDKTLYSLRALGDEQIAEMFNGGLMPLVPAALSSKNSVET